MCALSASCARTAPAPADASAPAARAPEDLPGVVDPWSWPRAAGASAHARAMEDIGPLEPADRNAPGSPIVNTNASYWTDLVGIAWRRDVDIDFDDEPVDLNGDGVPDARLTRHLHARGGALANPQLFGLTPTPDDPAGHAGAISVSTGFLGLREALAPDGKPTGAIGMTCWLCHGSVNPTDGRLVPGLPGVNFDYGALLATSRLLDEHDPSAVAYRKEHNYPDARTVRARLLMAGPGRQDLINEFGFDLTVPRFRSGLYPPMWHARARPWGAFNPLSVPPALTVAGLELQNWEGSEDSKAPTLERLFELAGLSQSDTLRLFGLRGSDRTADRRALLTDLRNLATLALQQDSYPGLLWSDALYGRMPLPPAVLAKIPALYAAQAVREELTTQAGALARPRLDPRQVARGREIFAEAIVGEIENRRVLPRPPASCSEAGIRGPVLAPIDPSRPLDAKIRVRCADCHNAAPLERRVAFAQNPPPLGRCSHCHHAHPSLEGDGLLSLEAFGVPKPAAGEVARCETCHREHADFGPIVYSSSIVLPFDADGDGLAQGDEPDDARAGGIGTEPLIQIEIPPTMKSKGVDLPVIGAIETCEPLNVLHMGVMWVRVPPLTALFATAPYLHNGSVPSIEAMLEPASRRPVTFTTGTTGFLFDTRIPGNRNIGHELGTRLGTKQKADLAAFLRSL